MNFTEKPIPVKHTKWLDIMAYSDGKHKTWRYFIFTKDSVVIGEVKWYAPWRQFAFFPRPNTVFERQCLQDITDFVKEEMEKWKQSKAKKS